MDEKQPVKANEGVSGRNFSDFASKVARTRATLYGDTALGRYYGYRDGRPVGIGRLSLDEIRSILEEGSYDGLRRLSYYYYRISGFYRNAILMLATLPLYQTLVTPIFDTTKKMSQDVIMKKFYQSVQFVDNLEVPINFERISEKVLLGGTFYGILRQDNKTGSCTIQELPETYCMTRYKDCHNLNIIEFNLNYFDTIYDDATRIEIINTYPTVIKKAWLKRQQKQLKTDWVSITAADGACCFRIGDGTPLFIASIPDIYQFEDALAREAKRDENELYKLLIERMPIDSKGQLVFQLDEAADIHASVASMLSDVDTVDVLTTFGETSLESVQDSSSANSSTERIKKYKDNVYDAMGVSELYFNADTSNAMAYANAKDEAIMCVLTSQYAKWIEYQINERFAKNNLAFDVAILPTTRINRKEIQSQYFQAAQYGYSKMAAGVATGLKQIDMLPTMTFENDYLQLCDRMIPLMSTYTMSSDSQKNKVANDINNEGGRPTASALEKSDRTEANQNAEG